jgi:hypothetical protein
VTYADVFLLLLQLPNRGGDVGGRQNRSRHLVKQRLEDVVVAAVDQYDVGVAFSERMSSGDTSKSAADDHDTLSRAGSRASHLQAFLISRAKDFC